MTLTPILIEERRFTSDTSCDLLEVCDSVIAVLTPAQLAEWIIDFGAAWPEDIINTDEATLDGSILQVFDIAGVLFVTVSDSGDEWKSAAFEEFCKDRDIACQGIVDSLDCEGISVEEIYTGECDDNSELLKLLHKVYN
jgi:hypothetical protein